MHKEGHINMLEGSIFRNLIIFAFPILLSSFLQQFFNSADSAVVGRFAGSKALAAVGGNGALINLFINLFNGLSTGAGVVIARLIGEGKQQSVRRAVPTVILSGFVCGIFLAFAGFFISKPLLELIGTPQDILELAAVYLKIYFTGMPFFMVFNFGTAVLRSYGESRKPLYALMVSGVINIILNLFFVINLGMGVVGVGIATVASNIVCSSVVFMMLVKNTDCIHLSFRDFHFDTKTFTEMAKIGMPAGLQGMIFSVSNVTIQSAVNSFGSSAVAASAATNTFENLSYFICNSICQSAMTFTSQNYGAGQMDRCRKIFRCSLFSAASAELVFDIVVMLLKYPLVSIFTNDPAVLNYAFQKMLLVTLLHFLICSYEVPGACLRGYGVSMLPAMITLAGCCGVRLFWVFFILPLHRTFPFLFATYPISWVCCGVAMMISYFRFVRKLK